jgi:hypothetical protein
MGNIMEPMIARLAAFDVFAEPVELVIGPFNDFRVTDFFDGLKIVTPGVVALVGLIASLRGLRSGGTKDDPKRSAKLAGLTFGVLISLVVLATVAAAAVAAVQNRTVYVLRVYVESGQMYVDSGTNGATRMTLASSTFENHDYDRLVSNPDPKHGAGAWLVDWLSVKYGDDRASVRFSVNIPVDLFAADIAIEGLGDGEYQLFYQVRNGEQIRLENVEDSKLATITSDFHLIIGRFGYYDEKIWVPRIRTASIEESRELTPKHPDKILMLVADFDGDTYDLAGALRGHVASQSSKYVTSRTPVVSGSSPSGTSGNPMVDISFAEELDFDLAISGTFHERGHPPPEE